MCLAGLGTLAVHGLDVKDIVRSLTQEHKHFSSHKPDSGSTIVTQEDSYRGRAQQLQPDMPVPPPPEPPAVEQAQQPPAAQIDQLVCGLEQIAATSSSQPLDDTLPLEAYRPLNSAQKVRWLPPPPGFLTGDTFNYLIYREKDPVTPKVKEVLDNIHGNLMLDLSPFTIIVKPNKILVMLFNQKQSYMDYTHRPAWSGASSDLQSDTMYIIEKTGFYALSVHELTHLYFDQYFLPTISPLWLSEGMAVYMQIYTSKQKPAYVVKQLKQILETNQLIPFEEMMSTQTLANYPTDKAEMWYTQAYSLVDYLLNTRSRDEFYKFYTEIKQGTPVYQALYRAYGMPFNKINTLQNVWLHDLHKAYKDGRIATQPTVGGKA
jgi:hypothetical protein